MITNLRIAIKHTLSGIFILAAISGLIFFVTQRIVAMYNVTDLVGNPWQIAAISAFGALSVLVWVVLAIEYGAAKKAIKNIQIKKDIESKNIVSDYQLKYYWDNKSISILNQLDSGTAVGVNLMCNSPTKPMLVYSDNIGITKNTSEEKINALVNAAKDRLWNRFVAYRKGQAAIQKITSELEQQ